MTTPEHTARQFQSAVEAGSDEALKRMATELARVLPRLSAEAQAAAERMTAMRAEGATPSELQSFAAARAQSITGQLASEVNAIMARLHPELLNGQLSAIEAGLMAARAVTETALPDGMTLDVLGRYDRSWSTVPLDAVRAAIGAQSGGSLGELLDGLGKEAGRAARDALTSGLVSGRSSRAVARELAQQGGLTAVRAMTIARTEQLRAYRTATRLGYEANPEIVTGYRRLAAKSARTCPACLALDGKDYPTAESFASHPNCRCALVPRTVTWRDLGFALDDPPQPRQDGAQWLAAQDDATQLQVLGKGGLAAYKAGVPLERFAKVTDNSAWGPTVQVRPLSEVV